jgi:hypothetical protein
MMNAEDLAPFIPWLAAGGLVVGAMSVIGWIHTTRLKIMHGYPLEGMWGQSLKPGATPEAIERIKLLSQENAALRAELGSVKDRLGNVERFVTDQGFGLHNQIEALREQRAAPRLAAADGEKRA